jgi:hypothetical protein
VWVRVKGEIEHAVDVFARSPNGGLIVMSLAEPGSWDDLGSDEGGAYGCQLGCIDLGVSKYSDPRCPGYNLLEDL